MQHRMRDIIEEICKNLPEDYIVSLCMEKGAAWVELIRPNGRLDDIDPQDDELYEQLERACSRAYRYEGIKNGR